MKLDIKLHKFDLPDDLTFSDKIAIDCEFMGLNVERDKLCLVQISNGNNDAHIIQLDKENYNAPNLKKLLSNKNIKKIFHFARADMLFIKKYLEVDVENIDCSKIASKLARTFGAKHGLKDLCKDLLNIELDKFNQTSDWGAKKLSKDQLAYAAQDVLFLHKLKIQLDEILQREGKMNLALECFESLKTRVKLDLEGFQELDIFAH